MFAKKTFYLITLIFLVSSCGNKQSVIAPKPSPKKRITRDEMYAGINASSPTERRKKKMDLVKDRRQRKDTSKKLEDLSFAELKQIKDALLEEENKIIAQQYIERMLLIGEDLDELKELRLELADVNFDLGNFDKAEEQYHDFMTFYPGSDAAEYAAYKAILSCFYQTIDPDRDQTKTKQALALAKEFLNKDYFAYRDDVLVIQHQCTAQLFESEARIFNFYLSQDKLTAADLRLTAIKEKFPQEWLFPQILNLECALAEKQGNTELVAEKKLELAQLKTVNTLPQLAQIEAPRKKYVTQF